MSEERYSPQSRWRWQWRRASRSRRRTLAKTKGGCTDAQVCCRYSKDGLTELDCMDAKACKDAGGAEVPNKAMCAA